MDGLPDGAWVAARAGEVQGLADDVRRLALAARVADDVYWRSGAAEAFRDALASDVRALAGVAAALDDVVAALGAHARALDHLALDHLAPGVAEAATLALRLLPWLP
jgi:hypothetical protein